MSAFDLESPRLHLGSLRPEDAPFLYGYRSSSEVSRFQGWSPGSQGEVEAFIARVNEIGFDVPDTWYQLAIRDRQTSSLVGDLGVHFLSEGSRQVEIGVTVAPEHQGRGIAREALSCLLDHLFLDLEKHRVIASVDPANAPMIAVLHRLGFRQEGHFVESYHFRGTWVDDLRFAILRREWPSPGGPGR